MQKNSTIKAWARFKTSAVEGHAEEKSDRSSKRGNGLLLSNEMDSRLKDLYEKYKNNPRCCWLIAGELDPDGDLSTMQVSRALEQLGFKVPAKAKIQNSDASSPPGDDRRDLSRGTTDPNNTIAGESSSLRKPMHSRKRVQAFSVDQEQKIKDLFEQFKDHNRCSYMIANALDDKGKISAARVSHKLKQLGLVGPKKKRSLANLHLRDEVSSDDSSEGAGKSDDETLLSPRRRGKQKRNGSHSDGGHSKKIARNLPEDTLDNEFLSSVLAKTKKMSQKNDDEQLNTDSTQKDLVETTSIGRDPQFLERGGFVQSNEQIGATAVDAEPMNHSSDLETGTIGVENLNESEAKSFKKADKFDDVLNDELADFDEDMEPVTTQENSMTRRRLRMVLDFDDDDEE